MRDDVLMVRDPVCGRWFESRSAHARRVVDGRTVYFCCASCEHTFDAEPELFVKITRASASAPAWLLAPG